MPSTFISEVKGYFYGYTWLIFSMRDFTLFCRKIGVKNMAEGKLAVDKMCGHVALFCRVIYGIPHTIKVGHFALFWEFY